MTELLFGALVVVVAAVVSLALAAPQRGARRLMLVGLCAATFALTAAVAEEFLGHPKPVMIEWRKGEATVLAHVFREGEAIYLWLVWPDEDFPRAYALPWDERAAREIAEAQQGVEEDGGEMVADLTGEESARPGEAERAPTDGTNDDSLEDREPLFYARPHPMPPDKPEAGDRRSTRFVLGNP